MLAARMGRTPIVVELLKAGAKTDLQDKVLLYFVNDYVPSLTHIKSAIQSDHKVHYCMEIFSQSHYFMDHWRYSPLQMCSQKQE